MKYLFSVLFIAFSFLSFAQEKAFNALSGAGSTYAANVSVLEFNNLKNPITGLKLSIKDISKLTKYNNKLSDIIYLELEFNDEKELKILLETAQSFINLKVIQFNGSGYFNNTQNTYFELPDEIVNLKKIEAIWFYGPSKLNINTALAKLSKLDNLKQLLFKYSNLPTLPYELLQLKNLESLEIASSEKMLPKWFSKLNIKLLKLNITDLDYNRAFDELSKMKNLTSLWINYPKLNYKLITPLKNKKLQWVMISGGEIEDINSLFESLSASKNLKSLHFSNSNAKYIPDNISRLKNLETLEINMSKNQSPLPKSIGKLSELRLLKISATLNELPKSIGMLKKLDGLYLGYNILTEIPDEIGRLKALRFLDLSSNKFKVINSKIGDCANLSHVLIQANPLNELPLSIYNLKKLTVLNAKYCNLTTVPKNISYLTNLERLDLSDNFINKIPTELNSLSKLELLDLSSNELTELPNNLAGLKSLKQLLLGLNKIKELPKSIGELDSLKILDLGFNDLDSLPQEMIKLRALEELNLSTGAEGVTKGKNSAREIYRKDEQRSSRNIYSNHIKNFPRNLNNWVHLKKLNLSNNSEINNDELFDGLFSIPSKNYSLDLENCGISTLPEMGWNNFLAQELDLNKNEISTIPKNIVKAKYLSKINLNKNKLPLKPVNLNQYNATKFEKLLWFVDLGLLQYADLPAQDSIIYALVEKSNNHYYRNEFRQCVDLAKMAIQINEDLAKSRIFWGNLGEASYKCENYREAIEYLTKAIKRDTSGSVRIMNSVIPDFVFRAKSYIKLGDTLSAIKDYETLSTNFSDNWGDVGLLYISIGKKNEAKLSFEKGKKKYSEQIKYAKDHNYQAEMLQLSLLELMIIEEDFESAEKYALELEKELKATPHVTLLQYLKACASIGNNSFNGKSEPQLEEFIKLNKQSISGWGYELFFKWLRVTKISKQKAILIRKITDSIKP